MARMDKLEKEYLIRVGLRIAEVRKQKGMTQTELGYRIDVERSNMTRIEKGGNNLTLLTLRKICNELEISVGELMHKF